MNEINMSSFSKLFDIYDINNFTRKRIGRCEDGGYVIPEQIIPLIENCITFGVGGDISFEEHLLALRQNPKLAQSSKLNIELYDYTVDNIPSTIISSTHLKKQKITTRPVDLAVDIHPNDILLQKSNILWKFDIEGSEYEFTNQLDENALKNVICVVMELHWIDSNIENAYNFLNYFENYFTLFHIHGNNHSPSYITIDNKNVPVVCEMTFINKNLINTYHNSELRFPIQNIDFPCNRYGNDMEINW